ncbi:MAG: metal ABC transporter substrate-binding protein [Anaerolineae bacterium]|nr:metal ABC transporter substrate-binding protein [Anaerolineae bacterium]MDW8070029.1 metal ABC transporter substrate-binding protein [Anaerolineae bacterium]
MMTLKSILSGLLVGLWLVLGASTDVYVHAATPTPEATTETVALRVVAIEPFLADIAQNVAGERLKVASLIPLGVDPHSFEPTPNDLRTLAESDVVIVHGAGLEEFLQDLLASAGGSYYLIEATKGLTPRGWDVEHQEEMHPHEAEEQEAELSAEEKVSEAVSEEGSEEVHSEIHHHHEVDPHFWLDPNYVIRYVENIRDGLSQVDPAGATLYAQNADAYIAQLQELDRWIVAQVAQIPPEHRLLVTNHESFSYFADRYGFQVIGTILPGVSTGVSPSAQQLAQLIDLIRETGAPAIFLETGSNPQLAEQIAREAGVQVVSGLYTHSPSPPDGPAPTYLDMIRYNTTLIVEALRWESGAQE